MSIRTVVTTSALVALVGTGVRLSHSRTHQIVGELLTRVETSDSVVALTFDDGPTAFHTDSVLAVLAESGARATFFMVGQAMERNPEVVSRVLSRGHEIGNHSYSHRRLVLRSLETIRREIALTDSLIRAAGQTGEILVRPPYGSRLIGLPLLLSQQDRPVVLWDLEPDTYHSDAQGIVDFVLEHVSPGSIILLHAEIPSRAENRRALRLLLPELRSRGYRLVTLSDLRRRSPPF